MEDVNIEVKCKKMLNRLTRKSRDFTDSFCVPDGLGDILTIYNASGIVPDKFKYSVKLAYDYDYFAFTKSTKSLLAIRRLLNDTEYTFTEDCFMQIRSIFENHILSRYVRENVDNPTKLYETIDNFILAPLGINFDYYINRGYSGVFSHMGEKVGKIQSPNELKIGYEKDYYKPLYSFLCQYTHCSFGALPCYFDDGLYSYYGNNFSALTYLLAIFVFTKIYEGVVTVNGEDLDDDKTMKSYYNLAYDSLELQIEVCDYLIDYYNSKPKERVNIIIVLLPPLLVRKQTETFVLHLPELLPTEPVFDSVGFLTITILLFL